MSPLNDMLDTQNPFIQSVLHLTDFSKESHSAFAHALAIATLRGASLTILHVGKDLEMNEENEPAGFPRVRETLERWGALDQGSSRAAVAKKLGTDVLKLNCHKGNPVKAAMHYLEEFPADFIVLSTKGRKGLTQWLHPSVAEKLTRKSKVMTLFISESCHPIISHETGNISLKKILVPVDFKPNARSAIILALRAAKIFGDGGVEVTFLHVGSDIEKVPLPDIEEDPDFKIVKKHRTGKAVDEILKQANEDEANLIVMGTEGHKGIVDEIVGSVTEQVLRDAPCPVLAIPVS